MAVVAMSLVGFTASATASGSLGTDDYPEKSAVCKTGQANGTACPGYNWGYWNAAHTAFSDLSSRKFGYRNCTDFVAWRMGLTWGSFKFPSGLGNALDWKAYAGNAGLTVQTSPKVGDVAWWGASTSNSYGHVAVVTAVNAANNTVSVEEYNQAGTGVYGTRSGIQAGAYLRSSSPPNGGTSGYSDGTYLQVSGTGALYEMAGGSPMRVTSLSAVPWSGQYTVVSQATIDSMPMYPRDGTAIRDYTAGAIYVVAGGFPFLVTSLGNVPNTSWVNVDPWSITHQLRTQPADETVIRNYTSGAVYVVSGGAPLRVVSMSNIPYTSFTNVDGWGITNQLRQYPTDGSVFKSYTTGVVYVAAGGAAMPVASLGNIPPITSMAYVDGWVVTNQLRSYPVDGTVIRTQTDGTIYVVAGGFPFKVTDLAKVPYRSWVPVDPYALTQKLLTYPVAGTYVRDYTSGGIYLSSGSSISHVTDWSTPHPYTEIDPWSIFNQLGGVR